MTQKKKKRSAPTKKGTSPTELTTILADGASLRIVIEEDPFPSQYGPPSNVKYFVDDKQVSGEVYGLVVATWHVRATERLAGL